ncbi:MAG: hypothetical protein LBM64_08690 [Deltaproteobacteria bacterium]|jgi:hypothetical protein|nr:hypothetical protein [Deltaproteobacteria bacterium]
MHNQTKRRPALPALYPLAALALLCLLGLATPAASAAAGGNEFVLEPGARVLVLPFTCYILPSEYQDAQEAVLQSLESNLAYALQQQGVRARTERDGLAGGTGKAPAKSPADVYLPLTPASSVSKSEQGELKAEPLREGQWDGEAPNSHMMAGVPPAQFDDSDIVPSGTLMLQPRAEQEKTGRGTPLAEEKEQAAGPAPTPASSQDQARDMENHDLGNEVIAQVMEESGILQKAAQAGFDYILTGSVSFIQAELKPAVYAGNREVTSVRTAFSCSYRLLGTGDGKVAAFGSASGRSGKVVNLSQGNYGEEQINNSVSVVLNQSIQAAALRLASNLTAPGTSGKADEDLSDQEYYQDSPGKRLKPAK